MFCSVGDSSLRFLSLFFSSPALPPLLVLLRIRRGFRGPTALRWHFGLRWRRQNAGGCVCFFFLWALPFCSFVSELFPCEGDRRVLAVLRPGVHLWNLAQVLIFHHKKFLHLCIKCV